MLDALVEEKQQLIEKNRQSIDEMNSLLRFERLLASFAAFFIDADPARINQGLQHALRSIGLHTATDIAACCFFSQDGAGLNAAYAWAAAETVSRPDSPLGGLQQPALDQPGADAGHTCRQPHPAPRRSA